jgi:META domain
MPRRRFACCLAVLVASAACGLALHFAPRPARAGDLFPFGSDLMLDVAPMHGSKRVPMLDIEEDGTASIDLWCASLHAQATVGDGSIAIVAGPPLPAQCEPDQQARDTDLLAALGQVTSWRRSGDAIELVGPTTLRFRLMTN